MKTAIIIVSILIVVAACIALWSRAKRGGINSFWDVVRNPELMPDLNQFHQHVQDTAKSISGSTDKVSELVNYFVFEAPSSRDAWTEKRILAQLGEEAYPHALAILRDQSLRSKLTNLTKAKDSLPEGPINRLCEIFDHDAPPPPEASVLLTPFLQSESTEIRKSVALIVGSIGSPESIPDLKGALQDEDEYVKSYVLMGILKAIDGGRIENSSREQFYELVAAMWPKDASFAPSHSIPSVMLRLSRERAIERLLSPDLLTTDFKYVWRILEVLSQEHIEIPRERLLDLIAAASKEPIEYPMDNVLEEALGLLGRYHIKDDLATLETLVDHPNKDVSRGAIKGLYQFHGFSDRIRDPWEVSENVGWNALTKTERHLCALEELDGEVNNGGFAQYFFNTAGDHWQDALEGLSAIGATERYKIMLATVKKFGDASPSSDRASRNSQLSKIVRKKEDPFNEQDTAWYKTEVETFDRLMFRYNLANPKGRQKAEQPSEP